MGICSILRPFDIVNVWTFGIFGIFLGGNMCYSIFPRFGMLCQEKSGNPVAGSGGKKNIFKAKI
jgi:hypothetical protein